MLKINVLLAAALAALGTSVVSGKGAISENLCDNYAVSGIEIAQVSDTGGCIVIVNIATGSSGAAEKRAVANSLGEIKVYSDLAAVAQFVKRAKRTVGAVVTYVPMVSVATVGDPIARLKTAYKKAGAEVLASTATGVSITGSQTAAAALGDDTATGTPQFDVYQNYAVRLASVNEFKAWATAEKAAKAAALTAAGIDPLTVV